MATFRKVETSNMNTTQKTVSPKVHSKTGSYNQDPGVEAYAKEIVESVANELGRIFSGITYVTQINKFDCGITTERNTKEVLRDDGGYILYNGVPVVSVEIKSSKQDVGTAHEKVFYKPLINAAIFRHMTGLSTGNFMIGVWYGDKYVADKLELSAAIETLELTGRVPILLYDTAQDVYNDKDKITKTVKSIAVININLIKTKGVKI